MVMSTVVEVTDLDLVATRFAALADPTRLRIVALLKGGRRCVCELRTEIPIAPNLLSYHLGVLRRTGVVTGTPRGRWVDYDLVPGVLDGIRAAVTTPATGP